MTVRIESSSLEIAYAQASEKLECSIVDMTVRIEQHPRSGIFGFGKRSAIIVATLDAKPQHQARFDEEIEFKTPSFASYQISSSQGKERPLDKPLLKKQNTFKQVCKPQDGATQAEPIVAKKAVPVLEYDERVESVVGNFYAQNQDVSELCYEIRFELIRLFDGFCFSLEEVTVEPYGQNMVEIKFTGDDSALLIGKEGYRYKALSYMLYAWINGRYGLGVRLEIAEFLRHQEDNAGSYLDGIKQQAKKDGKASTKPLDEVLFRIAFAELRAEFGERSIGVRALQGGDKIITVYLF